VEGRGNGEVKWEGVRRSTEECEGVARSWEEWGGAWRSWEGTE